jgi:hypothetical protein
VEAHLEEEVTRVIGIHDDLQIINDRGILLNTAPSAMPCYQLLRYSLGHMMRHHLRVIRPTICKKVFAKLDEKAIETMCNLFAIDPSELSTTMRTRITLPTSCSGFAITALGDIAQAAFLGTWAKIGLQVAECVKHVAPLHVNQVPGLRETYESLRTEVGDVIMERLPTLESILLTSTGELQQELCQKLHERKLAQELAKPGPEQYFTVACSTTTAMDIMNMNLAIPGNKLDNAEATTTVRRLLGLQCIKGDCNSCDKNKKSAAPAEIPVDSGIFGAHKNELQLIITRRHHRIRDCMVDLLEKTAPIDNVQVDVKKEKAVQKYGFTWKPEFGKERNRIADIVMEVPGKRYIKVFDVTVTHPNGKDKKYRGDKHRFLNIAETAKKKKYAAVTVPEKDFIPLVFDSFGGYSESTFDYINSVVKNVAGNDRYLHTSVMRRIRDQIAIAIHRSAAQAFAKVNIIHPVSRNARRHGAPDGTGEKESMGEWT